MSIEAVTPLDVFGKRLGEELNKLLDEIMFFINEQALQEITHQKQVRIICNEFAEKLRSYSSTDRDYFLSLLRLRYFGAKPPWGEVRYTAYFPANPKEPARLVIYLMLVPGDMPS